MLKNIGIKSITILFILGLAVPAISQPSGPDIKPLPSNTKPDKRKDHAGPGIAEKENINSSVKKEAAKKAGAAVAAGVATKKATSAMNEKQNPKKPGDKQRP